MKEKRFFCSKNVSGPSNPPDELAQNVSNKKNPFGRILTTMVQLMVMRYSRLRDPHPVQ